MHSQIVCPALVPCALGIIFSAKHSRNLLLLSCPATENLIFFGRLCTYLFLRRRSDWSDLSDWSDFLSLRRRRSDRAVAQLEFWALHLAKAIAEHVGAE